jgi:hypothetical protein
MEFRDNVGAGTQKGPTFVDPFCLFMAFYNKVQWSTSFH